MNLTGALTCEPGIANDRGILHREVIQLLPGFVAGGQIHLQGFAVPFGTRLEEALQSLADLYGVRPDWRARVARQLQADGVHDCTNRVGVQSTIVDQTEAACAKARCDKHKARTSVNMHVRRPFLASRSNAKWKGCTSMLIQLLCGVAWATNSSTVDVSHRHTSQRNEKWCTAMNSCNALFVKTFKCRAPRISLHSFARPDFWAAQLRVIEDLHHSLAAPLTT